MSGSRAVAVKEAHDVLLRMQPAGSEHSCAMCVEPVVAIAREDLTMANVAFSEDQHLALMAAAVKQETAQLDAAKTALEGTVETLTAEKASADAALAAVQTKLDVVEAEKAAALADADAARVELAEFKAEIERKATIAALVTERSARVAAANDALPEAFFTNDRALRWAEMSVEAFDAFIAEMAEVAAAIKPGGREKSHTALARESAAFTGGEEITGAKTSSFLSLVGARRGLTNIRKEG